MWKKIGFLLPLVLLFCLSQSADVNQSPPLNQQTLNQLQEKATSQLADLYNSIETLKAINRMQGRNLTESREQRTILERQLDSSLTLASDYFTSMNAYKEKYERSQKIQNWLWLALAIWIALKLIRITLGLIPQTRIINKYIPWWLDVLI